MHQLQLADLRRLGLPNVNDLLSYIACLVNELERQNTTGTAQLEGVGLEFRAKLADLAGGLLIAKGTTRHHDTTLQKSTHIDTSFNTPETN